MSEIDRRLTLLFDMLGGMQHRGIGSVDDRRGMTAGDCAEVVYGDCWHELVDLYVEAAHES